MFLMPLAHRAHGSAYFVVARTGSRAAVLRRSESTRFSSASDDKVGGFPARSAASGSEQVKQTKAPLLPPNTLLAPFAEAGARWPLPSSLASLACPGQRRASLAQHGGRAICRRSQHRVAA
jgi:hypothetical protein